ncbi:uncharacterized protein Dwil_GK16618 [Drosophila willistoni]|uniref:MORN repeat-containing protein 5 n=1 Tax=Drosophila willistoni TaxID=7260 RepID=B4MMT6_DROWI|nr:uncharacterized protein LOC6639490 [Drosophila willistoni]EDW73492.1 uncharacterized protein Dwil_GK16618 [Drosophila willistoni]
MPQISYSAKYPTDSKFSGVSDELGMQGYGLYVYPDGTRYLGYFHNNRFHGLGLITLGKPYNMSYQVEHIHGKLTKIIDMVFSDDLMVDFKMDENNTTMAFDNWSYCTKKDRRFCGEILTPLAPVGPQKYKTKDGPNAPHLDRNIFDLGFGQLNQHGFLMDVPNYMSDMSSFYVGCREIRGWIREHCHHGPLFNLHLKQQIRAKYARQIIRNNMDNQDDLNCATQHQESARWHKSSICRDRASEPSSESGKALRAHMASTSHTFTSEMDKEIQRESRGKCKDLKTKPPQSLHNHPVMQFTSESGVCRIN